MAGGKSQRVPAARLCRHPSGCADTCTAALEETPSEFRELLKIQLHRLRSWQLYVFLFFFFFPLNCRERQLEGIKSNVF